MEGLIKGLITHQHSQSLYSLSLIIFELENGSNLTAGGRLVTSDTGDGRSVVGFRGKVEAEVDCR